MNIKKVKNPSSRTSFQSMEEVPSIVSMLRSGNYSDDTVKNAATLLEILYEEHLELLNLSTKK